MKGLLLVLALVVSGCTSAPAYRPTPAPSAEPVRVPGVDVAPGRGNKSPYVVFGRTYEVMPSSLGYLEIGIASWYGKKFHGRLTSNGETFDMYQLSAAHKALPLPTVVRITNLDNGHKVVVRVNDRGPFHDDRLIDLSFETALKLGFSDKGTAPVVVEALDEINYPDLVRGPVEHESFYLQAGAFSRQVGAEALQKNISDVIGNTDFKNVDVRVLESELAAEKMLYKVWIGPIKTEAARDALAQLVETSNLGTPVRVKVD